MFTPRAASASADPVRLVTARLPCLATGTPAAATTSAAAVLMLNVPEPSPPVPQVSMQGGARGTNGGHVAAQGQGGAGDFLGRFALEPQRREQQADLPIGTVSLHDRVDRGGHLVHRQVFAGRQPAQGCLEHLAGSSLKCHAKT